MPGHSATANWKQKHKPIFVASEPSLGLDVLVLWLRVPHHEGNVGLSKTNYHGHSPDDAGSHTAKTGPATSAARGAAAVCRLSLPEAAPREADG